MLYKCVVVVVMLLCAFNLSQARKRKTNCGLTCYRWSKCIGQLDGTNRPGQLGDTGILVLNTCAQLDKGCNCIEFLKDSKSTTSTTTTESNLSSGRKSSSRRGPTRFQPQLTRNTSGSHLRSSFRTQSQQLTRLPRKQEQSQYKDLETDSSIEVSTRSTNRFSSYRRHLNRHYNRSETTEAPATSTTTRRSFGSNRRGSYSRRYRLSERL